MTGIWFELLVNLLETLITVDFISRFCGFKYSGSKKIIGFAAMWAACFTGLTITNYITVFEGFAALIPIVLYLIYAALCLAGSRKMHVAVSILTQVILVGTSAFTMFLFGILFGKSYTELITQFDVPRIIAIFFSKMLYFYVTRIFLKIKDLFTNTSELDIQDTIPLLVLPIMTISILLIFMYILIKKFNMELGVLISSIIILSINFIVYYLFYKIKRNKDLEIENKLIKQQYNDERKNFENAQSVYNDADSLFHDIKEHLGVIYEYAEEGNNEEICKYIKSTGNLAIPEIYKYINTDDMLLNTVINSKISLCKKNNIDIRLYIGNNIFNNIEDADKSVLIGNLMNNAIEAEKKTEKKYISLSIQNKNNYTIIHIENVVEGSVLGTNSELKTTKRNKKHHGIGIRNIEKIVKKYDGMIEYYEENENFCCDIMIYDAKFAKK